MKHTNGYMAGESDFCRFSEIDTSKDIHNYWPFVDLCCFMNTRISNSSVEKSRGRMNNPFEV